MLKAVTSLKIILKKIKVKGKEHTTESSLKTFSRFIILQEKRNISIREVLNYELGTLSLSIACAYGGMVKSNKASFGRELKKIVPIETVLLLDFLSILMAWFFCKKCRSTVLRLVKFLITF